MTWDWVCEEAVGLGAFLYQQGAPPDDRILSVSSSALTYSTGVGCSWNRGGGAIADAAGELDAVTRMILEGDVAIIAARHAFAIVPAEPDPGNALRDAPRRRGVGFVAV